LQLSIEKLQETDTETGKKIVTIMEH